ncbi:MAG: phosphatidylglycerophosphatase A [Desulfuromonadales bacterium]|nr:phosphatidylglycerophosphatase A [Desulfuromonadales bacterium]
MRRIILFFSSNAGLGYAPVAPGTFGTLAGIPAFWLLANLPPLLWLLTFAALLCLSFWISDAAGKIYGVVDDGRIVIDELVGYLVTVAFLPCTWWVLLGGFCWFRVFDIFKPWPASYFDKQMKNGVGVVLDDVVAGVYGAVALRLCLWLFA